MNIISIAKYRSAHQNQKIDLDKEHAPTRSVPAASEPGGLQNRHENFQNLKQKMA